MRNIKDIETDKKLGLTYSPKASIFRLWAYSQKTVRLALYDSPDMVRRQVYHMVKDQDGVFELKINGDLKGKYYSYLINDREVTDPYGRFSSVNSKKSYIGDLKDTNPPGFLNHRVPENKREEAVIYEVHVKDFTYDQSSGVDHRGKFLGMAESGVLNGNIPTGMAHLRELGISHLHLMPIMDYITVDERENKFDYKLNYNWGYDPELYNGVEGSYASRPDQPENRIYELKKLIMTAHENKISVVLDVVYNHTYKTRDSNFNIIEPNYYYRMNGEDFSNGSGCGNEFASETKMGRKFIIDSLVYWAEEYKVDGFRFDLMALLDLDTIEEAMVRLREINPNIIIYGEPWMALGSTLDYDKQIRPGKQKNKGFSLFNGAYRDALKGDNDGFTKGYLQGDFSKKKEVQNGIIGSVGLYMDTDWASPLESINYFNAHDNLIFQDKLINSGVAVENLIKTNKMAFSILLTSFGLPFFHAGNEFMRSKSMNPNTYNASIDINKINWKLKEENYGLFSYVREMIKFRKKTGIFYEEDRDRLRRKVKFVENNDDAVIAYFIENKKDYYFIVHNLKWEEIEFDKKLIPYDLKDGHELRLIWDEAMVDRKVDKFGIPAYSTKIFMIKE